MNKYILAIDEGTTNVKAVLVDPQGHISHEVSRPVSVSYPEIGWVEQNPVEIWARVCEVVDECLETAGKPQLYAVAVTNQRETTVMWDRMTGKPLAPAIVWQCKRTIPMAQQLRDQGLEPMVRERTGLTIDAEYPSTKMRWLLDNTQNGHERAANGEICFGSIDSWLLWNLTNGALHVTDASNASRTQLYSLQDCGWDSELLDLFGVPLASLPAIAPSSHVYGETVPRGNLPGHVPIASLIGDSHASLFGHHGFQRGAIKVTYGTGSSLVSPMDRLVISSNGLSSTVAWETDRVLYAFEGLVAVTGAAVQWAGEFLQLADPVTGLSALAKTVPDNGGVYFVPALAGLSTPYWKDSVRGLITGLTRGTTAGHLARATFEAIGFRIRDVFDVMNAESGADFQVLLADGGPSRNDMLMQFQADILGVPVMRSTSSHISLLGSAYLAGLAVGVWSSLDEIEQLTHERDRFEPNMTVEDRETIYAEWQAAINQTLANV